MTPLNLTESEIVQITGRVRAAAQFRALQTMGIPAKINPGNRVIVCRETYEQIMGVNRKGTATRTEPDWSRMTA